MSKNYIADYLVYTSLKALGPLVRLLPINSAFFCGRRIGDLFFYFDLRHRAIAYSNLKKALGEDYSTQALKALIKGFYENYGQNFIEIFFLPLMDSRYFHKYITVEGAGNVQEARKNGKGVILLSIHAGSWELSNMVCANLGFPFRLFVRDLGGNNLDTLINSYRRQRGGLIIEKQNQLRQLVTSLRNNEAIGMTADQGGKSGIAVDFFKQSASMPTGALRLALKYGASILPVYYTRIKGPYCRVIIMEPFALKKSADPENDIRDNLQRLINLFEKYIRLYPKEYLWTYRIWKYSKEKTVLILSDGKAGHLRQAQAVFKALEEVARERGLQLHLRTVEIKYRQKFSSLFLVLSSLLSGRYACQGCLCCLKKFLTPAATQELLASKPDIIISSGSALAGVNFVLGREFNAKSIVLMRPGLLSTRRFDLVIIPWHDRPRRAKNILVTEGTLNLIDQAYLAAQAQILLQAPSSQLLALGLYIGLLIGGEAKKFSLSESLMRKVCAEVKRAAVTLNAQILVTTSRRTSSEIAALIKEEFFAYGRCKLLVIANEKNIPEAVGGILGLSSIVVITPESISMLSEAASGGRYVFTFQDSALDKKHRQFIAGLAEKKYIYLSEAEQLALKLSEIWKARPQVVTLKDNIRLREALKRII